MSDEYRQVTDDIVELTIEAKPQLDSDDWHHGDLSILQGQIAAWAIYNFGDPPAWECLLGLQEELGELSHAFLKRQQGIRNDEKHSENIRDAVGDIVIFLLDFCRRENLSFERCLIETWNTVSKRDWVAERKNTS